MAAVGNLNDFVKYQMAKGMETGGAGAGGTAAELAVGFGMAQQMMQQGLMKPQADAAMKSRRAAAARRRRRPSSCWARPTWRRCSACPRPT